MATWSNGLPVFKQELLRHLCPGLLENDPDAVRNKIFTSSDRKDVLLFTQCTSAPPAVGQISRGFQEGVDRWESGSVFFFCVHGMIQDPACQALKEHEKHHQRLWLLQQAPDSEQYICGGEFTFTGAKNLHTAPPLLQIRLLSTMFTKENERMTQNRDTKLAEAARKNKAIDLDGLRAIAGSSVSVAPTRTTPSLPPSHYAKPHTHNKGPRQPVPSGSGTPIREDLDSSWIAYALQ
jgi:hypothetical protein